mgnify:CR=1 FL=1
MSSPPQPPALPGIALGGAALGNLFSPVPEADVQQLLERAWSDGCRSFDTAPHYGHGLSEHRVGQGLRAHPRDSYRLSSKVGRLLTPCQQVPREQHAYVDGLPFMQHWDYSAAGIQRSVEDSLQRLGLARLDTAYVHDCDAATHGADAPRVLRQVLDETLPALRRLQCEGLVGEVGLGVNDHQVVLDVLRHADLDALLLAGRYTLLDHSALPALLPECQRRGVRVALGGLFNSGLLASGTGRGLAVFNYAPAAPAWVERTARIETVCERHGVLLRAAALQFARAHPAVQTLLLGARSVGEWQDCLQMLRQPIPAAFWTDLRRAGLLPDAAPTP